MKIIDKLRKERREFFIPKANRVDETAFTSTYLQLFDQIWNDPTKLEDVTDAICDHIASVYQENSPERIYFLMLYNKPGWNGWNSFTSRNENWNVAGPGSAKRSNLTARSRSTPSFVT